MLVTEAAATVEAAPPSEPAPATGAGEGPRTSHRASIMAAGTSAAKSAAKEVGRESPWVLASAAILLAFAMGWFAGILLSFRHAPGITSRDRILQFFEPGQLIWALAILVAVALLTTGRRFDSGPARKSGWPDLVSVGLFVAGIAVTFSALVGVLVELSNFGNGIDEAFAGLIVYLAVLVIGAAETWFAHSELGARREASKPSG